MLQRVGRVERNTRELYAESRLARSATLADIFSRMHERISINPKVCHGQACIKGTRNPVHQIFRMLANGDTVESLLRAYPSVQREDILACFDRRSD